MILSEESQRELAPEGQHLAICVDVADLGLVETTYNGEKKMQHKVRLVFELATAKKDGSRFVIGERFTASLHEKAALRKFLQSWRGRAFTPDELKRFDTETLIGANAIVQIVHNTKGDRTYDNIDAIMKPVRGSRPLAPSGQYVRAKDRPANGASGTAAEDEAPHPADVEDAPPEDESPEDDPIPF